MLQMIMKKNACTLVLLLLVLVFMAGTGVVNGETVFNPAALVPSTTKLEYHGGPLLTGPTGVNVYLLWYGSFSPQHKLAVSDFFASFHSSTTPTSVSAWWRTVEAYRDARRGPVSDTVSLAGQASDPGCSLGKTLRRAHVASLVQDAITKKRLFPLDAGGVYLVLTAPDVALERFCVGSCGFHSSVPVSGRRVVFAHVGDPAAQCPGLCSWPYAVPAYGPPGPALLAPNGVGVDGMIMNVAAMLAGSTTNPFGNGYFQGDALAPLEAATACAGIFGDGAYPGYPGKLMTDPRTRASFNVYGVRGRRFLLPAMWDPVSLTCKV